MKDQKIISAPTWELCQAVIEDSVANNWSDAVKEWDIVAMCDLGEAAETCICGHEGIRYAYTIKNIRNGKTLYPIGNVCIKKFQRDDMIQKANDMQLNYKALVKFHTNVAVPAVKNKYYIWNMSWDDLKKYLSRRLIELLYMCGAFNNNGDYPPWKTYQTMLRIYNKHYPADWEIKTAKVIITKCILPWLQTEKRNP